MNELLNPRHYSIPSRSNPMTNPVTLERRGRIGVLRINNPPVNAISAATIAGLAAAVESFEADRSLDALVVHCDGRIFSSGGDITQFDDPGFSALPFNRTLARLEQCDRIVVAVLHGTTLGGGLELAMACHYRVALPGTRVGLPEVKLGILPGSWARSGCRAWPASIWRWT